MTALRADSLRCSGVIAAALAGPPFLPPLEPSLAKYALNSADGLVMLIVYKSRSRKSRRICEIRKPLTYIYENKANKVLDIRERLTYSSGMNTLTQDERLTVLKAHAEGTSIRSIERMTGIHRDTIMRLIVNLGGGCARFLNNFIRKVRARRVQVDEIWTYVFKKQGHISIDESSAGIGDQYVVPSQFL